MRLRPLLDRVAPTSVALLLAVLAACFVVPASAQEQRHPPAEVYEGSAPFTETVADMVARDNQYVLDVVEGRLLPPPRHRVINHRSRRIVPRGVPGPEEPFAAPAFAGQARPGGDRFGFMSLGPGFAGIGLSDEISYLGVSYIPPDTMGAIGPLQFLEVINGSVTGFHRDTGARVFRVSINNFFTFSKNGVNYPRNGAFDPRALYDRRSGRFFVCALEVGPYIDPGNPGLGTENNHVLLAVSRTSDATGTWDKYVMPIGTAGTPGVTFFTDFDTLGVDSNGVYVAATTFRNETGQFEDIKMVATPLAPLLTSPPTMGATSVFTGLDTFATPHPVHNLDAVGPTDRMWFVGAYAYDYRNVTCYSLTWSGGTPSLSSPITVNTPAFSAPFSAPASGSSPNIDVGDMRMGNAVVRNSRLWCARHVGVNSSGNASGADRTACEWMELNVSGATPTLVQSGRVYDPGASPRYYYYPSVMVNALGHAAMGFSGSKGSEFVGAYITERLASDAAGTMRAVTLMKAGQASYSLTFGGSANRWGDYSYTGVDPTDDMTIWTVQEYASSTANRWGTWISRILAPAPTCTNPGAHAGQGAVGAVVDLTGTGFFEPGPDFPNHLMVAFPGGSPNGISNVAVTVNSTTSLRVTFNVSASAQVGARDIVVTNPDGQSVTVTGGLTIDAGGDSTPPVTAAVVNGTAGGGGWYVSDLTIDLSATDAGSGVKQITYRIDGGTDVVVAGSAAQVVLTADGTHLVEYWAEDNASNVETTKSVSPKIDTTEPGPTTMTLVGTSAELASSDAAGGSGLAAITYRLDGGPWQTYSGPIDVGLAAHELEYYATDVAGNEEGGQTSLIPERRTATQVTVSQPAGGTVGQTIALAAQLTTSPAGTPIAGKTLHFIVDGVGEVGAVATGADGLATVNWQVPAVQAGQRALTVEFSDTGDPDYTPSSGQGIVDIARAATRVWVRSVSGGPGDTVELAATLLRLPDDARIQGRTLTFAIGAWQASGVTDATGTVRRNYTIPGGASQGNQAISVAFTDANDPAYLTSAGAGTLTVGKAKTRVWVRSLSGGPGQTVQLAGTLLRNWDSARIAGRTLTFTIGAWQSSGVTDATGTVYLNYTIPGGASPGQQTIGVAFTDPNDPEYLTSSGTGTLTITKVATRVWVRSLSGAPNQTVQLAGTLLRLSDSARIQGRTLTFTIGSWSSSGVTDATGTVKLYYTIPPSMPVGSQTITVAFTDANDAEYAPSSGTGTLTVTKASTRMWVRSLSGDPGQTVQLAATLMRVGDDFRIAGRTLTLRIGAWSASAVTGSNGTIYVDYAIPMGASGTYDITGEFTDANDPAYLPSSSTGVLTVNATAKEASTITVTPAFASHGSVVQLRATLRAADDSAPIVGRTLWFTVGSWIGSGVTDATGQATVNCTVPLDLPFGPNTITVDFLDASDPQFLPSTGTASLWVIP